MLKTIKTTAFYDEHKDRYGRMCLLREGTPVSVKKKEGFYIAYIKRNGWGEPFNAYVELRDEDFLDDGE
jgi:hypothetical protein